MLFPAIHSTGEILKVFPVNSFSRNLVIKYFTLKQVTFFMVADQ